MKQNNVIKESQEASLKDIESSYGKGVAKALVKYCNEKDKDIEKVINNTTPDRVGLTEWDWFEKWAKRTLKLDIYGGFSDDWMDDLDKDAKKKDDSDDNDNDLSDGISSRKLSKSRRRKLSRGIPVHDLPSKYDMMMKEGSGSRYGEQDIIDYIASSIYGCGWIKDSTFDDYDPILEIETTDGDKFEISVKKI